MDYVWFYEEEEANNFFLDCLERGIYCKKTYGSGMYGIEVNVTKTCQDKNTILVELEE